MLKQFSLWLTHFLTQDWSKNERRLVVLQGDSLWAQQLLMNSDAIIQSQKKKTCLIYGEDPFIKSNVATKRFHDKLGSESHFIIFADRQFNIDAFSALSGTLIAGGILFLIIPQADHLKKSIFLQRLLHYVNKQKVHVKIEQGQELEFFKHPLVHHHDEAYTEISDNVKSQLAYGCMTHGQLQAVNAIEKVLLGHRKRPLVLTADRGRGKSSALAIACAKMLLNHDKSKEKLRIVITAGSLQALDVFFRQLSQSLPSSLRDKNCVSHLNGVVEFIAVDELTQNKLALSLLLVDEAAAIPVFVLDKLLSQYHRMVFSSTVHGYEGAGRGFTLKFTDILSSKTPQWQSLHLQQPIRWGERDPVEKLVFDTGLLNATLPKQPVSLTQLSRILSQQDYCFRRVTVAELAQNESLLAEIFSILVTAHYQTKPSDLKMLLDNEQIQVFCLFSGAENKAAVLAVAVVMREGKQAQNNKENNITLDEINAVKCSQKRLKNHFIPQSLLTHCGFESAFDLSYFRIMRIAVHPQLQQQGVGQVFLKQLVDLSKQEPIDFIGASFGMNYDLLDFWLKQGFKIARVGFTKDKASGEHSALVLHACSAQAKTEQHGLVKSFYRSFEHLLVDEYKYIPAPIVALILSNDLRKENDTTLSPIDVRLIKAFSSMTSQYSNCVYSLYLWFKHYIAVHGFQGDEETLIMVSKLLQKQSTAEVCQYYQLTGKKALNTLMVNYVKARYQ